MAGSPRSSDAGCSASAAARVVATSCKVSPPKSPSVERFAKPLASASLWSPAGSARMSRASCLVCRARASSGRERSPCSTCTMGFSCSLQAICWCWAGSPDGATSRPATHTPTTPMVQRVILKLTFAGKPSARCLISFETSRVIFPTGPPPLAEPSRESILPPKSGDLMAGAALGLTLSKKFQTQAARALRLSVRSA